MGSGGFLTTIDLNGDGARPDSPTNAIYLGEMSLLSAVCQMCRSVPLGHARMGPVTPQDALRGVDEVFSVLGNYRAHSSSPARLVQRWSNRPRCSMRPAAALPPQPRLQSDPIFILSLSVFFPRTRTRSTEPTARNLAPSDINLPPFMTAAPPWLPTPTPTPTQPFSQSPPSPTPFHHPATTKGKIYDRPTLHPPGPLTPDPCHLHASSAPSSVTSTESILAGFPGARPPHPSLPIPCCATAQANTAISILHTQHLRFCRLVASTRL